MIKAIPFIPVASELSDPLKNKYAVSEVLKAIDSSNLRIHEVVTGVEKLSDLRLNELGAVIIFVVTGGTERMIAELARRARYSVILVHKGMNSLPAAIEAKSFLNYLGVSTLLLKSDDPGKVNEAIKSLRVLNEFPKHIALIGEPSPWLVYSSRNEVIEFLRDVLKSEVINISLEELVNEYNSIKDGSVYEELPKGLGRKSSEGIDLKALAKAFKLYLALKKLLSKAGTKVFSIKCFDLIKKLRTTACLSLALLNSEGYVAGCEGDVSALISMVIGSKISGKPSFMGNLAWLDNKEVVLAHCTAPLSLVNSYELTTHYESGIGVGIRGYLGRGSEVTLFKLDPLMMEAKILYGVILDSGEIVQEGCRTQFRIRVLEGDASLLMNRPSGSHYVLILGRHKIRLKYIAELLGFQ